MSLKPFQSQGAVLADRPAVHEQLRAAGPVVEVEAPAGGPAFIVTDLEIARIALGDDRFAKDTGLAPEHWPGADPSVEPPPSVVRSMTTLDGTQHRALRRMHAPLFTRRRLLALRPRVEQIALDLLTALATESGRPADLAAGFTSHFPLLVVCDLLGVRSLDLDRATAASEAMSQGDPRQAMAGMAMLGDLVAATLVDTARDGEAALTDMLRERSHAELGDMSDDEFVYTVTGLIFAGQVTTDSFLGFLAAHHIATGSDRHGVAGVSEREAEVDRFVSEALRLHPPVPFTLWRFTREPVELAGVSLPAGAPVLVDIEGINTDPVRSADPYLFDPGRDEAPSLTFGDGPHVCIGAQLARLEAAVMVETLVRHFPDAVLAEPLERLPRDRPGTQTRRLARIPVWLQAANR